MRFHEVTVNLTDPWMIHIIALMVIDTVTNLAELGRIDNNPSAYAACNIAQLWLTQPLWTEQCVHDNGSEFVGTEIQKPGQRTHRPIWYQK